MARSAEKEGIQEKNEVILYQAYQKESQKMTDSMRTYKQFYRQIEPHLNYTDRKENTMKVLYGFIIGLLFVFVIGAVAEHEIKEYLVTVKGDIVSPTIKYQSTLSSITPDGDCYLAITNTMDGKTEIFKITKGHNNIFAEKALQRGHEGRVVADPSRNL